MLKKFSAIGYATALVTAPAWLAACSSSTDATAQAEEPTVLFSLSADSMRLENASGDQVSLVMEGVDPHTIWFTDRPARESGTMSTSNLVAQWASGETFAEDPPNAALVLHQPIDVDGQVTETLVVEMLDADYDAFRSTLRADLRVLSDEQADSIDGHLSAHGDSHDAAWPSEANDVSLFIDTIKLCSNPSTCNSGSTENYTYNSTIYFQAVIGQADGSVSP